MPTHTHTHTHTHNEWYIDSGDHSGVRVHPITEGWVIGIVNHLRVLEDSSTLFPLKVVLGTILSERRDAQS